MAHSHTVRLPLGALLSPCTMCGTGTCGTVITTETECEAAAAALGLSDTSTYESYGTSSSYPQGCSFSSFGLHAPLIIGEVSTRATHTRCTATPCTFPSVHC